jgi:hypothetical protein
MNGRLKCVQISDNYAVAAVHCREFSTAAKASIEAVKLSNGAHINIRVLVALVDEVESRRVAKHSMHDPDASRLVQDEAKGEAQLGLCSAQHADLEDGHNDLEGNDGDMGVEAARLLDAFSSLGLGVACAPDTEAATVDADAKVQDDAQLRQQMMLVRFTFKQSVLHVLHVIVCKLVPC